jgi:hypothetical protein
MTSERPMKTSLRVPKIHRKWRTTLMLVSVAAFLSLAVAIEVASRHFLNPSIRAARLRKRLRPAN